MSDTERDNEAKRYLTTADAADYLGVSKGFLDRARMVGDGPLYCAFGRKVMYRPIDLDAWAASKLRRSIDEAAPELANI